jgi:hypothetical protein
MYWKFKRFFILPQTETGADFADLNYMKTNIFIKNLLLTLTVCTLGIGCTKSKDSKTDESTTDLSSEEAVKPGTKCTQDNKGFADLQVSLMNLQDSLGNANYRYVHLRFNKIPSEYQSSGWDLQIYRWTVSSTGATNIDSTALFMHPEKKVSTNTFQKIIPQNYEGSNGYQIINFSELQQIGVYGNVNSASPQTFFNGAYLLVDTADENGTYKVLRVVFRNSSDGTVAKEVDILLPPVYANPNLFSSEKSPILSALHPLNSLIGQSWTDTDYVSFTDKYCF